MAIDRSEKDSEPKENHQSNRKINEHDEDTINMAQFNNHSKDNKCGKECGKECEKNCGKECDKNYGKECGKNCGKECGKNGPNATMVSASNNYKGNDSNKDQNNSDDKKTNENSKHSNKSGRSVLFDSLVESEKTFIRRKLKYKIYDDYNESSNICVNFYRWIVEQFQKIKYKDASSTLISDLEYLQTQCNLKDLFIQEGAAEKTDAYRSNIESANVENYKDEMDSYSLACACRDEIKTNLVFFTKELEEKLLEVYRLNCTPEEKKFVIERTPFLMNYRPVFKLAKELINSLDSKNSVEMNKSVNLWADLICRFEAPKEKRIEILKDLLKVEYDYIPVTFYE